MWKRIEKAQIIRQGEKKMSKGLNKLAQNLQEKGYKLHAPPASNKDITKPVAQSFVKLISYFFVLIFNS